MSTIDGKTVPLERLQELASDPAALNQHLLAVLLTMQDECEEVRAWASDALETVETPSPSSAAQLAELAQHVKAPVAGWACKLLGRLGDQASGYQGALASALSQHASVSVRQLAALALKSIPNLTEETVAALQTAASDTDARLSRLATDALSARQHT